MFCLWSLVSFLETSLLSIRRQIIVFLLAFSFFNMGLESDVSRAALYVQRKKSYRHHRQGIREGDASISHIGDHSVASPNHVEKKSPIQTIFTT